MFLFQICYGDKYDRDNIFIFALKVIPLFALIGIRSIYLEYRNYMEVKEKNQNRPEKWQISKYSLMCTSILFGIFGLAIPSLLMLPDIIQFNFVFFYVFVENWIIPGVLVYKLTKTEFRVGKKAIEIRGNEMIEMNEL